MNRYYAIFRVLVMVMTITFTGNMMAILTEAICIGGCAISSATAANKLFDKNEHAKKSALETMGLMVGSGLVIGKLFVLNDTKPDKIKLETYIRDMIFGVTVNFVLNYGIRQASQALHDNRFTFDQMAENCDILPESIAPYVNPIARTATEIITHPQMLTFACFAACLAMCMPSPIKR
ncbi:MAG TPA: hypothetical protein VLB80_00370 [Candidatus Babeliales bacterium]|nr:hypothetical protein [Candidatus Babeliales bacterium]